MKTNRTLLAACITALLANSAVHARDAWNFHESEWNDVRSYGKMVVAHDSVEQWGPWDDFAEPSSGLFSSATLIGFGQGDSYRTNPVTNRRSDVKAAQTTEGIAGCDAGAWCGYAIFQNSQAKSSSKNSKSQANPWIAGLFMLLLSPDNSAVTAGDGKGTGSVEWQLTSLGSTQPTVGESSAAIPASFGGGFWIFGDNGLHHFRSEQSINGVSHNLASSEASNAFGSGAFTDAITGHLYSYRDGKKTRTVWISPNDEVAVGKFTESVAEYVSGKSSNASGTTIAYVAGVTTSQAYLSAQRAGDVNATYVGGSYNGANNQQGTVTINVQFGSATWDGTWQGDMNFKASGSVSGANISANSISGIAKEKGNPTYSGTVNGTFYGQQAGSIGGVTQVQKSINNQVVQSQNTVFLVNKVPTASAPR